MYPNPDDVMGWRVDPPKPLKRKKPPFTTGYEIIKTWRDRPWRVIYNLGNGDWMHVAYCKTEDGAKRCIERQKAE